jgi:hypothetical protein
MALITEPKYTFSWAGGVPPHAVKNNASNFQFSIQSIYLSMPYELKSGDTIRGKILKVESSVDRKEYSELRDQEIALTLYILLGADYLFISKADWESKFREYGLVTPFYLSVKLERASSDARELGLYTKKDILV